MKIRTKLTLKYTGITAAVFTVFILSVYLFSGTNRDTLYYRNLKQEAITKADLFLTGKVDAATMQEVYHNNRRFIDEVEVAIYDTVFNLIYHDAVDIDIVEETPEMLRTIMRSGEISFDVDNYHAVGILFVHDNNTYIITAAGYDGYGHAKQRLLGIVLVLLWAVGLFIIGLTGYYLAAAALSPVKAIIDEVEEISDNNLDVRIKHGDGDDELAELSQTFNDMLDRLEKSFESQKMFISNVSHELRTPLAALIAELEIGLIRDRENKEYERILSVCLDDAKKIEKLSAGLLDLAKADSDPQNIERRNIRLDEILLDSRAMILKANKEYTVELIFDHEIDDDLQITVLGNEYLLKTAFTNLIENNCKFSEDKKSSVIISYFNRTSIIRFSDAGIGISESDIYDIFKPFKRGSNGEYYRGYGIGLALVKKILELHNGTIRVSSREGEGTVFTVEIPNVFKGPAVPLLL
ncbi:MAG: HAMP domain-containing histidine kinase [Rikenellaceae bacterium]|nr:HAMP domain-containing histidine kinase [Rikenellaceae bacterium]